MKMTVFKLICALFAYSCLTLQGNKAKTNSSDEIYTIIKCVYFDRGQDLPLNLKVLEFKDNYLFSYEKIKDISLDLKETADSNRIYLDELSQNPQKDIEFWSVENLKNVGITNLVFKSDYQIAFHHPVFSNNGRYAAIIYEENYFRDDEEFGNSYGYILKKNEDNGSWTIITSFLIYEYTS